MRMKFRVIGETMGRRTYESGLFDSRGAALVSAQEAIRQNNLFRDGGPPYQNTEPMTGEYRRWKRGPYCIAVEVVQP